MQDATAQQDAAVQQDATAQQDAAVQQDATAQQDAAVQQDAKPHAAPHYILRMSVLSDHERQRYKKAAAAHNTEVDKHLADPMHTYDAGFDLICPSITYLPSAPGAARTMQKVWRQRLNTLLRDGARGDAEAVRQANHAQSVCNAIRKGELHLARERIGNHKLEGAHQRGEIARELTASSPRHLSIKVDHHVRCSMVFCEDGIERAVGYHLHPRSSTGAKTAMRLSNSTGIIDSGYRGNIVALFDNLGGDTIIDSGARVVQICPSSLTYPMRVEVVGSVRELGARTSRGEAGLGSTGI